MYRKISAILIPTLIAVGIIVYMLYQVWGDLLTALQHIVPVYLGIAIVICLAAWWLRGWRYQPDPSWPQLPDKVTVSQRASLSARPSTSLFLHDWEILSGSLS